MKPVTDYELIDHGIDNCQYFQGCGLSHTEFEDIATGAGFTINEALDGALEQLAQNNWETEQLEKDIRAAYPDVNWEYSVEDYLRDENPSDWFDEDGQFQGDDCELYYYLSIRVK